LDAAWGAYIFFGRIRLSDGLVTLTRKPVSRALSDGIGERLTRHDYTKKYAGDEGHGTWIFEGYMHSRRSLVGRWRSFGGSEHESIGGIFSLTKVEEPPARLY